MSMNILNDISRVYLEQVAAEAFVDPEQGETPSGRTPLQNVSDHPSARVRKKAVGAFKKQMGKEYGGTWKSRTNDPVAEAAKPDYLDFDKDGNKKESMKKALKDKEKVTEAVKGQDTELRRAASAERSAERKAKGGAAPKIPGREGPSVGKTYADYQKLSIKGHDKATRGKFIHGMATNEALDPVGQEDSDIDNDGKSNTKSDKYLLNRRKVRGAAIKTHKESFSNWRQDLSEVMDTTDSPDDVDQKEIKEKKIQNKIKINPDFKEAVEELGGVLLETVEVEEGYQPIGREKESAMYRRAGNLARTSLSSRGKKKEEAQTKSAKIVSAITRQKEKERFDRIGQSPAHNEEVEYVDESNKENKKKKNDAISKIIQKKLHPSVLPSLTYGRRELKKEEVELDEKTLTPAETKKKEQIVKSMKKSAGDFEKRYPGRGKEVMYATATKQAKKVAEAVADQAALSPQELQKQKQKATLDTQIAMLRKQSLSKTEKPEITKEEYLDERRKEDKVAGTPRKPRNKAFEIVAKSMGTGRLGVKPRGVKKDKGGPTPGPSTTPAQKLAKRRAQAKKGQDFMTDTRGT